MRWGSGLAVAVLILAGCTDPDDGTPDDPSIAFKLAAIDGHVPLDEDDPAITPYRRVLAQLDEKCIENRTQISDQTVAGLHHLEDHGVTSEDLLSLLRAQNRAVPAGSPDVQCAEILSALIVLMI